MRIVRTGQEQKNGNNLSYLLVTVSDEFLRFSEILFSVEQC